MRPVRAVGLYLVFVFVGGALLAPWVYSVVNSVAGYLPGVQAIASKPFPRYVSRSLLILGLVGLWPFLRASGLSSWHAIGLGWRPEASRRVAWGFVFGLASLAAVVVIALAAGAREPNREHSPRAILVELIKAGSTAFFVAPIEEIFFRGALFGALRKTFHWVLALLVSSAIYALLHFLMRADALDRVGWSSGLAVLLEMMAGFGDVARVIPGFLNLMLVGIILGLAYQWSASLYFSIGLHAGWIFWLKAYAFVTREGTPSRAWIFGTSNLINGWVAFIVLTILLSVFTRLLVHEERQLSWKEKRLLS